jgi:hypothetical protein
MFPYQANDLLVIKLKALSKPITEEIDADIACAKPCKIGYETANSCGRWEQ